MIFVSNKEKHTAMKKILFLVSTLFIITSCATTKDTGVSRAELRNEKKLANQEVVKNAVENQRFILKFNKLHFAYGGLIDLMPRSNYIIVDGNKAVISAAYLGRQYEFKPIAAINVIGRTKDYQLTNIEQKGRYEIKLTVDNGANSFDVFLSITKDGTCSASMNTLMIDNVSYTGHLVPIKAREHTPLKNNVRI